MREGKTSTDGDLGTDDTVTAVEALGEHVHGTALAVGNALAAAEELADDGRDGGAAHVGEAVAAVGRDEVVILRDRVLDADGDGLLPGRQMAEAPDLLLLVQPVGGHLHLPGANGVSATGGASMGLATQRSGGGIYLTTTMSLYICLSSFFVTSRLYEGGSSS